MRRMTRRELIIGSAAAAAAGYAALEGCNNGSGPVVPGPAGGYTLEAQYADTTFIGKTLRTRTYGSIPGPTLYAVPGERLRITVKNSLPPNPPEPVPQSAMVRPVNPMDMQAMEDPRRFATARAVQTTSVDPMNNPHAFNTTNLHVHGLQVVPHLFNPVGTSDPSTMMIAVESGESFTYDLEVPADQPAGLRPISTIWNTSRIKRRRTADITRDPIICFCSATGNS